MKLKIIITTMALTAVCLGVHAQEKKTNPNPWFVQGQMGASYSTGDADFGKLIAPTGAIAVGKYFPPYGEPGLPSVVGVDASVLKSASRLTGFIMAQPP